MSYNLIDGVDLLQNSLFYIESFFNDIKDDFTQSKGGSSKPKTKQSKIKKANHRPKLCCIKAPDTNSFIDGKLTTPPTSSKVVPFNGTQEIMLRAKDIGVNNKFNRVKEEDKMANMRDDLSPAIISQSDKFFPNNRP